MVYWFGFASGCVALTVLQAAYGGDWAAVIYGVGALVGINLMMILGTTPPGSTRHL